MEDELEDKVLYQTYISHMKLLSKCAVGLPLNSAPLNYVWRLLRLYILRPEVIILSAILFVIFLYLQTLDVWSRGLFARLQFSLDKSLNPKKLKFLAAGVGNDKLSWELKEGNVAAYAVQGRRPKMEDRFVINEDINNTGISLFAVFDGHGGEFAANYARDKLIKNLNTKLIDVKLLQAQTPKEDDYDNEDNMSKEKVDKSAEQKQESGTVEKRPSIKKGSSTTDECTKKPNGMGLGGITDPELLKKIESLSRPITREVRPTSAAAATILKIPLKSYLDPSKFSGIDYGKIITDEILAADRLLVEAAKKNMDVAGTTALIALLEGSNLIVANVGDSRGVMCDSKGNAIPLSFDHKPQQIKERNRIKQAGGFITFNGVWRVAGILATSRALGDYPLKDKKLVIADPDILTFDLSNHKPMFILLASDGLWDTFSNEEAVSFIKERLNEPHFGAKSITLQSYYRGSLDNITVLVINFRDNKWSSYSMKKNN